MIFFVGWELSLVLMNLVLPLKIGARDVAFPFLNTVVFGCLHRGPAYLISLVREIFRNRLAGLSALSGLEYSPGVGVDYWIWSLQIAGLGSLLSAINFLVTILKMRCPGMTMKMPIFVWAALRHNDACHLRLSYSDRERLRC